MASKSKKSLLDFDEDEDVQLGINENYAERYMNWRQKEELQKLKTKYGEEVGLEDASSSSSEEEDEDAEALTGTVDKSWFRALAAVRSNDPRIYQKDVKFFDSADEAAEDGGDPTEESSSKKKKKKKDDKPLYMKDFERKLITEKGGMLSESDDEGEEERLQGPSYNQEQEAIKRGLQSAIAEMSSDDEDEDMLIKRIKTRTEEKEEEEEFIQFLKGEKKTEDLKEDKDIAQELAPLKDSYSQPDMNEGDKQLWNIVLDRGFRAKGKDKDRDWYEEQMALLHADEEAMEQQEQFENKYNFRFEEPDKNYIKSYERNPEDTLRQKENKRAEKRQEVKDRKAETKERKHEEIRQLKNMKRKEILEKLEQLKEVTGNEDVPFSAKDVEDDFDPAAHDRMMQERFGNEYYDEEELEKPQFEDDEDDEYGDDEDWDAWTGPSSAKQEADRMHAGTSTAGPSHSADDEMDESSFNMDADYDPLQASYTSGKKKKKSKFKQLMEKQKPQFDEVCRKYEGSDTPFGDYLDEYFKLDCEDIIAGDVKCRFRYRKTVPNDYGLTIEEILKCPDPELNAWASLKKITQIRNEDDETYEVRKYKQAKMLRKKLNILPSLKETSEHPDTAEESDENRQIPRKKGKQHKRFDMEEEEEEEEDFSFKQEETNPSPKKKKKKTSDNVPGSSKVASPKKKKKKRKAEPTEEEAASAESDEAPRKKKKKVKHTNQSELLSDSSPKKSKSKKDSENSIIPDSSSEVDNGEAKKKKKKKPKADTVQTSEVSKKKVKAGGKVKSADALKKRGQSQAHGKRPLKVKKKKKGTGLPKGKGYQAGDMITSSRLLALGVDPRKFKYTKHRIMQQPAQD